MNQHDLRLRLLLGVSVLLLVTGYALLVAGFLYVFTISLIWWEGLNRTISTGSVLRDIGAIAAAVAAMIVGYPTYRFAASLRARTRKRLIPDALSLMAKDSRPPVLYLRSFGDDEIDEPLPLVMGPGGTDGAAAGFLRNVLGSVEGATLTQEERLAISLRKLGPFIAIGDPREQLPDLGAARLYVGSERWEAVVTDLLQRAQLVVIRPGASAGIWWEINRVIATVPADRVVFWIPGPGRDERGSGSTYPQLRRTLAPKVTGTLPDWQAGAPFLCFSKGWMEPRFEKTLKHLKS